MPLGGSDISWAVATPAGSESVGLGDDRIRSMKTSIASALDNEHNFPTAGGANTGYHRLGSARAHFGTQSRVSSGDTDGRLMVTSDTSRLFGVGSTGTALLGPGPLTPSFGSLVAITFPQRAYIAMEAGQATGGTSIITVTFPSSGFSGVPFLLVVPTSTQTTHSMVFRASVVTQSGFTGAVVDSSTGNVETSATVDWLSIGTRTL